jgi:tRNA pseudouridine38-40 synthase
MYILGQYENTFDLGAGFHYNCKLTNSHLLKRLQFFYRVRQGTTHPLKNIKLILEYDGTNYCGWQSQAGSGLPTIQDTLEQAIATLTKESAKTVSSGRTDAGVHAVGHVANFKTTSSIPPHAWAPALNHLLPADIRVVSSEEAADDFHARFSALGKIYKYRILNRQEPTALYRNYAWHISRGLNVIKMRRAAAVLVGKHDFSAFRGSECNAASPVRTIRSVVVRKTGEYIEIEVEADAFLQYMMRNIAGTLAETGLGRFTPDDVAGILKSCDRTKAGRTAPPHGLYLVKVFYAGV